VSPNYLSARFDELEAVLLKRVSASGAWPHWLHMDDASTSLVGTAHALAMLRMRGYEAHDPVVAGGLAYLAREVRSHTRKRGGFSRYPAYALWGLMRFPAGLANDEIFDGARFSADWLLRRARPSGGWSVAGLASDDAPISLPATMAAVHGLDRLPAYTRGKLGERCRAAATAAREGVVEEASGSGSKRFWTQRGGGRACPGATSLAVLTLAGGSDEHRAIANLGINYLLANPDDWTGSVHLDLQLDRQAWRIMSFSVGLRAVLHPCARKKPKEDVKRAVLEHMDCLWDEPTGAWAVEQGHHPSTTGSYAVAAAVRALKNAWDYDPTVDVPGFQPPKHPRPRRTPTEVKTRSRIRREISVWEDDRKIRIAEQIGPEHREFWVRWDDKAKSQWPMLLALLSRTRDAATVSSPSQYDTTLSWAQLVKYTSNGSASPLAIERAIDRINEKVRLAAQERRFPPFQSLIGRIVPGNSQEVHYGIEEAEVTFEAPE
jgi:hypothetical protein